MGIHHSPHNHPIPISMGIPMEISIPTAALRHIDRLQTMSQLIRSGGRPLCQISCKSAHGVFSANKWNITKFLFAPVSQKLTYRQWRRKLLKWGPRRGPKAEESKRQRRRGGVVRAECPPPCWEGICGGGSENFEFFDLQMVCFGVFCVAKFNILVTTKSCKDHIKCMGNESGCDKEKAISILNTNQSNPVSPSVTSFTDRNPLRPATAIFSHKSKLNFQFHYVLKNLSWIR